MRPTVIAYLDALGSKNNMIKDPHACKILLEILSDLTRQKRDCLIIDATVNARRQADGSIVSNTAIGVLDVQFDSYQDTAVLWAVFDRTRFQVFCDFVNEFFCLALQKRIPLRGGISVGEADMNKGKTVYSNRPMAELLLVEESQEWIGVTFGPSFKHDPYRYCFKHEHILEFSDHIKFGHNDYISTYSLNWPKKWRTMYPESPIKVLNEMNVNDRYSNYYNLAIRFCEKSLRAESIEE